MKLQAFDMRDVTLGEGPCLVAREANREYLHELDVDRLLWAFRRNAGLPTGEAQPLGGWEAPEVEVRGHFPGHYLSACALMYRATGDEELKRKGDTMVAELAKCQEALGGQYLSAFPESFLDRLETRDRVTWAPLYVIHKIMAGLYDMYTLAGNEQALQVLTRMGDYYKARADRLTDFEFERMLQTEFGGMSEVLHNLYGITRDPDHLAVANRYDQAAFLGPLALKCDNLSHIHGNTQIPKICGAARRYELTGEPVYRDIAEFFWHRIVDTRCYATGGTTSGEVWPELNRLAGTLSATNQECCKTHNMLKVTRYLMRWTGDPMFADYYERAFWNGIIGTNRADNGQLIYYVPLATGLKKVWGTPYDSFWCCYGTGIETFSKLNDSIYFHDDDNLYVNLFIASSVDWKSKGVRVEQVTEFPEQQGTAFVIHAEKPTRFGLQVHVPYWATQGVTVSVNGARIEVKAKPTSYLPITWTGRNACPPVAREWKDGDKVEVRMPFALHAWPMPDDPELVAVMYGPVVLAGTDAPAEGYILGDPTKPEAWVEKTEEVTGEGHRQQGTVLISRQQQAGNGTVPTPLPHPATDGPLSFVANVQGTPVKLIPWYQVLDEPYGVYWTVTQEGSAKHKAILAAEEERRKREARIVDRVKVGDPNSERAHNLQGERMGDGPFQANHHWRHAPDGWFSWDLKVLPDQAMTLYCEYWGSDVPPRTFDILVDGTEIATQALDRNKPNAFFQVEYPLPPELVKGKEKVTVRFQAQPGNTAGGVFDCGVLK